MNKIISISTKDYTPLSYQGEYYHKKYDLIKSFLSERFGNDFSKILAQPTIEGRNIEWFNESENNFKRVSEFNKDEQDKILRIYWGKINKINELSSTFSSSSSVDKKKWAKLITSVFNSNNNIIYSDGNDEVIILWGWKFETSNENYIPEEIIPEVEEKITPFVENEIPVIESFESKDEDIPKKKTPWYLSLFDNLLYLFKYLLWFLLILALLWFIMQFDYCSDNKTNPTTKNNVKKENKRKPTKKNYTKKDKVNYNNDWNIDENNTGLEYIEYKQVIQNDMPKELYENLLVDDNGKQRLLPNKERVYVPINMNNLIINEKREMIAPDRINIYLKKREDKIEDFAQDFKEKYPDDKYQIIYRDNTLRRVQIRVPKNERIQIKKSIKESFSKYNLLVWDETIFESAKFNDPGLNNSNINYYFNSINMNKAWEITTGKKDIIIAVIDDGFDLNHEELNKNIVKPYNVLSQNENVYANEKLKHGTHVAGLAIAKKNNNKGVCGIAPDCSFMPIQIGHENFKGFSTSSIIDGILYAINNGADVINLSIHTLYGEEEKYISELMLNESLKDMSRDDEFFYQELFEIANDSNITIVFCAGNCEVLVGLDAMKRDSTIISVSAIDKNNKRASFTNFGKQSTISAPGVDIYSCIPGGNYDVFDGTSMSSPIIAGVVGLIKSTNPELTNTEIIEILRNSGKNLDPTIGPLVQADKALLLSKNNYIKKPNSLNSDSIKKEIKRLEKNIIKLRDLLK